jgi:hypothetical protein
VEAQTLAAGKRNAARLGAPIVFVEESGFLLIPTVRKTWVCSVVLGGGLLGDRLQLMGMSLPVLAVEPADDLFLDGSRIKTPRVHTIAVRMRARNVERLHAADRAEEVLRRVRIEPVAGQTVPSRQ